METTDLSPKPIDFAGAIRVMRGEIAPAEENNAESRGDLSAGWKKVEECGVHKGAAKAFYKLLNASTEKRDDFLRTWDGLCEAGNVSISEDLVDKMTKPFAPAPQNAKAEPREPLDDADLEDAIEDAPDRGGLAAAEVDAMDDASIRAEPIKRTPRKAGPRATSTSDLSALH
jgi:hypothetical protein